MISYKDQAKSPCGILSLYFCAFLLKFSPLDLALGTSAFCSYISVLFLLQFGPLDLALGTSVFGVGLYLPSYILLSLECKIKQSKHFYFWQLIKIPQLQGSRII